jgi:hypothetical protein
MEKKYIIGGLAIVGALALFAYLKPTTTKRNSEGFFGANGGTSRMKASLSSGSGCTVCEGGFSNYWAQNGACRRGDKCVR